MDPAASLPSGIPSHFLMHISYEVASNPLPLSEEPEYAQATWHTSLLRPECSPCSDGPLTSVFCGLDSLLKSKSATLLTNNVCKHWKPSLLLIHFMLLVLSKAIVCMCVCLCVCVCAHTWACVPKFRDITRYLWDIKAFHFCDFEKQIKGKRIDSFPTRHMSYNLLLLILKWNTPVLNVGNGPWWCPGIWVPCTWPYCLLVKYTSVHRIINYFSLLGASIFKGGNTALKCQLVSLHIESTGTTKHIVMKWRLHVYNFLSQLGTMRN